MEERVYAKVCALIEEIEEPSTRVIYPLRLILRLVFWSILHDRPMYWSCDPANWSKRFRPKSLPDQSTLSRRMNHGDTSRAFEFLHQRMLEELGLCGKYAAIDGRPLVVGGASQDRDARPGRAVRGMGRGYKLFAAADRRQVFLAFEVHAMNQAEQTVARRLVARLPPEVMRIVGDKIYDSMPLHKVARRHGRRLYTPLRENRVGRRQQPRRLHLHRLCQKPVGRRLLRTRDTIERTFARLSTLGFGFKSLPPWVRGLPRVRLWVSGKILLYHCYRSLHLTPQALVDA